MAYISCEIVIRLKAFSKNCSELHFLSHDIKHRMIWGKKVFTNQSWINFFLGARLFGCATFLAGLIGHAKNGWSEQKQCFLFLITYTGPAAFILNVFPLKVFATRLS